MIDWNIITYPNGLTVDATSGVVLIPPADMSDDEFVVALARGVDLTDGAQGVRS